MRLQLFTSAVAAVSLLASGASAQDDGTVTSISTYTIYKTVERVVQTEYATMSSSSSSSVPAVDTELPHEPTLYSSSMAAPVASASASMMPMPSYNGTAPGPSGTAPMGSPMPSSSSAAPSAPPQQEGNGAASLAATPYAFAALAGLMALAAL